MARSNWLTIASWTFLAASLLLAFLFGWFPWGRLVQTHNRSEQVNHDIEVQAKATADARKNLKDVEHQVAAPAAPREDPDFIAQLKTLMDSSGVHNLSISHAVPQPLPNISMQTSGKKKEDAARDDGKKDDKEKKDTGYSLQKMPLEVVPQSTTLVVQGTYGNIDLFVRRLYNYRFNTRAININSVQLKGDDKGQVSATLLLTRFVRRPDAASVPPAVGAAQNTGAASSAVTRP